MRLEDDAGVAMTVADIAKSLHKVRLGSLH